MPDAREALLEIYAVLWIEEKDLSESCYLPEGKASSLPHYDLGGYAALYPGRSADGLLAALASGNHRLALGVHPGAKDFGSGEVDRVERIEFEVNTRIGQPDPRASR